MSIVREYSFPWSATVHWGPSEHGGSETVSGSVEVEVIVDTAPVEASAAALAGAMTALAGGATAAGAYMVREKEKAANRISNTLISEFFGYIRHELSEKATELANRIPALMESLKKLSASCADTRNRMQVDFQRITGRHADNFSALDRNLRTSLEKLESSAFDAAAAANEVIFGNVLAETTSRTILAGLEELDGANALSVAGLKRRAIDIVEEGVRNIRFNLVLSRRISNTLVRSAVGGTHAVNMPVVVLSATRLDGAGRDSESRYHIPTDFPGGGQAKMDEAFAACGPDAFRDIRDQDAAEVDRFFRKRLSGHVAERSDLDAESGKRLSDEVLRLWEGVMKTRIPSH